MNSKSKGNIALASAISYYIKNGYEVSLPLTESTKYDLIVDKEGDLYKVQCKFTGHSKPSGNFTVPLRVMGGNQSFHTAKTYSEGDFDFIFAETKNGDQYEIPADIALKNKNSLTLSDDKYGKYRV